MGYDADHPRALGEVGREGVAVSTLADMEVLFDGIPLDEVTTSMTINCSASVILAMYFAVAEQQGVPLATLGGTIQNDMLKEFIAQKEWISPARAVGAHHRRHDRVLRRSTRRAGTRCRSPATTSARPARRRCRSWPSRSPTASATSQAASSAASTSTTSRRACRSSSTSTTTSSRRSPSSAPPAACGRRSCASASAPRSRARCCCARTRRRPAARSPRSSRSTTSCASPSRRWPAVLGGTQSLHTNSMDETLALPTEEAVMMALRTQQIIAEETGRHQHRRPARRQLLRRGAHRPDGARGRRLHRAASTRWAASSAPSSSASRRRRSPRPRTATSASSTAARRSMVGVNKYQSRRRAAARDPAHRRRRRAQRRSRACARARRRATPRAVRDALAGGARRGARAARNLMPPIIDAVKAERHGGRDLRRLPRGLRRLPRSRPGSEAALQRNGGCASWSPSPASTGTTAAPRSSRARCATPASR